MGKKTLMQSGYSIWRVTFELGGGTTLAPFFKNHETRVYYHRYEETKNDIRLTSKFDTEVSNQIDCAIQYPEKYT